MARPKRIILLGERVGAPFSAWHINADHSVTGVTLYACNDKKAHVTAQQAYTARGSWVWTDTSVSEYFTNQTQALETAYERANRDSWAAHQAYIQASGNARKAFKSLRKHQAEK